MSTYIPDLTKYRSRYTAARKHASEKGQPVYFSPYTRKGLSEHQIKCFIDFVMSPSVMTDSPFLETKLKLSNGELYQVPQIILNSVCSRVVEQYQTFCRESGIGDVASDRSYMRILQPTEPNIRKSMKGLDNYAADGAKGIDDLKKIVNVLGKEWEDGIFQQLSNCKQYLKLDYKETKANLEKINLRLKEAKEETEQIRRNCQEIIKTYQESEEIKSNSLDQQVKKNRLNFYFRRQKIKTKKSYIQEL